MCLYPQARHSSPQCQCACVMGRSPNLVRNGERRRVHSLRRAVRLRGEGDVATGSQLLACREDDALTYLTVKQTAYNFWIGTASCRSAHRIDRKRESGCPLCQCKHLVRSGPADRHRQGCDTIGPVNWIMPQTNAVGRDVARRQARARACNRRSGRDRRLDGTAHCPINALFGDRLRTTLSIILVVRIPHPGLIPNSFTDPRAPPSLRSAAPGQQPLA